MTAVDYRPNLSTNTVRAEGRGISPGNTGAANSAAFTALLSSIGGVVTTVTFSAGTYNFDSSVTLNVPGLRITTEPGTVFRCSAAMADGVFIVAAADVQITGNATIDGNGLAQWCLHGLDTTGLQILGLRLTGSIQHGLYLRNVDDAVLERVTATNCGTVAGTNPAGFYISDSDNMTLIRCKSVNAYQHGFYIISDGGFSLGVATGLQMVGCQALNNGDTGFSIRVSRMTMTSCYSWGNTNQAAAFLQVGQLPSPYNGDSMTISACVFGGTVTNGVGNEVSLTADRISFSDNIVYSTATNNGVRFVGCNTAKAVGNIINALLAGLVGALRFDTCTDFTANDNSITGPGGSTNGIYVAVSSDGLITDNRLTNFANGVRLDATLSNNVAILFNMTKTVTAAVNNSSTGTGIAAISNGTLATFDLAVALNLTAAMVQAPVKQTLVANGAVTIDASKGYSQITLQANATSSSITNPLDGQVLKITWVQDATGGRTYVWPANCLFAGGVAPADTTANKRSTVVFQYEAFTGKWTEQSRAAVV